MRTATLRVLGIAAALAVLPGAAPGNPGRPGTQTLHFDHERVARAFEKGEVIFGGDGGANYMVHASRREGPGQAEVHALDTDIIYVIDGTATLVTEGTVVRPKTIEPNEIRGPEIAGGKSLPLTKGDVAIVPKGIPHWFRDVPGPFTYYVVKVR